MNNQPTVTWKVTNLDCYPTYQQNTDVVFTVHWDCLGQIVVSTGSLSGSTYNSRLYGTLVYNTTVGLYLYHTIN